MKTLAIETSCDDTSLAIVHEENGSFSVDKILAYSQINDHQKYWWVVPEIAFRLHSEQILALLKQFDDNIKDIQSISVTTHPWLAWSLLVGKTVAHMLWKHYDLPVIWVHHIYGHIFSLLLDRNISELIFPRVILTASGGHNEIYLVNSEQQIANREIKISDLSITKLWKTLDDAAGECFDKVARMLRGPYPWWQWIGEQALKGTPNTAYRFKRILLEEHENPYDFSFSGIKSQAYNLLKKLEKQWVKVEWQVLCDIAYEFQEAVVDILIYKLSKAAEQYDAKTIWIVWWVSANDRLFEQANSVIGKQVLRPMKKLYSTDNWAMIGVVWLMS